MEENWESASVALADNTLTTSARTVLGWIRTRVEELLLERNGETFSVTIKDVADLLGQSRNSSSTHLNALENAGHLERFLPGGAKSTNHWRLV